MFVARINKLVKDQELQSSWFHLNDIGLVAKTRRKESTFHLLFAFFHIFVDKKHFRKLNKLHCSKSPII